MKLSGSPKVVGSVKEVSNLNNPLSTGPILVKGPTARGVVDGVELVRTRIDFLNKFGYRIDGSLFPLYCLRILDAGGQLYVSRAGHYTDTSDKDTLEGTKATGDVDQVITPEVLGTANGTITLVGDDADIGTINVDNGVDPVFAISSYVKQTGDTVDDVAAGLIANLTAGYTGVASGTGGTYTITAPVGSGVSSGTFVLSFVPTGTMTGTIDAAFAGGADAVIATTSFEAAAIGDGYDSTTIAITESSSNVAGNVDITVTCPNQENPQVLSDTSQTIADAAALADLNALLIDVQITNTVFPFTLSIGEGTLTGGVQDVSAIVDQDYIGNASQGIGWFAFDNTEGGFLRIANIEKPSPDVDVAMVQYAVTRRDLRAHTGTPLGTTPDGAKAYRLGTSPYTHSPIDNWEAMLVSGDESINDPDDNTKKLSVPGIVEYLALKYVSDAERRVWLSTADFQGNNIGVVKQANNGVDTFNFLAKGYKTAWDDAYENGVNALVQNGKNQLFYRGNRSLLIDTSKLLSKDNIADLLLYAKLNIVEILEDWLSRPLDAQFFKGVYQAVLPFINFLEEGRGIEPGEGVGWAWIGDQDADTKQEVVFNNVNDLDQGKYRCRFVCVPISATEYIGFEVTATNPGSFTFTVVSGPASQL